MDKPWEEDCDFIDNYNTEFADVSIEYEQAVGRVVDELREAKSENAQLNAELGKCAWHGAFEEYEEDIQKLMEEIERLKAENEKLKSQVDEYKFDSDCLRDIVDRMER